MKVRRAYVRACHPLVYTKVQTINVVFIISPIDLVLVAKYVDQLELTFTLQIIIFICRLIAEEAHLALILP